MAAQGKGLTFASTMAIGEKSVLMPVLGLGTWQSPKSEVTAAVFHAIKSGYRHLDCAAVYENEDAVGAGITKALKEGVCTRAELWVTSKLWLTWYKPCNVRAAYDKTAKALGVEYLDQYLMHWSIAMDAGDKCGVLFPTNEEGHFVMDSTLEPIDTWKEMERLNELGLCKTIGVSNFNIKELQTILDKCKIRPATNQVECHPYLQQLKLRKFMEEKKVALTAYCPLGSKGNEPAEKQALDDPVIVAIAKSKNKSPAQICLRWGLQMNNIVIPKSVQPHRIEENRNLFDFDLTDDEMAKIANIGYIKRHVNPPFRPKSTPVFPKEEGEAT